MFSNTAAGRASGHKILSGMGPWSSAGPVCRPASGGHGFAETRAQTRTAKLHPRAFADRASGHKIQFRTRAVFSGRSGADPDFWKPGFVNNARAEGINKAHRKFPY